MTPHQPAKRRRLDDALNKPFRSPMKTAARQAKAADDDSTTVIPYKSQSLGDPTTIRSKPQHSISANTTSYASAAPPPPSSPRPPPPTNLSPPPQPISAQEIPPNTTPTAHIHALQRKHTSLQHHLTTALTTLETSAQAQQILARPERDAEIARLIQKWKVASRAAAEEVFAGARDKVNRMGGVRGLRERERERERARMEREREDEGRGGGGGGTWGWGGEGGVGDGGYEGARRGGGRGGDDADEEEDEDEGEENDNSRDEAQEEGLCAREERLEREGKGSRRGANTEESQYDLQTQRELEDKENEKDDEVDEEAGYTMDMMLKTMNIDLNAIGFDKGLQKWID